MELVLEPKEGTIYCQRCGGEIYLGQPYYHLSSFHFCTDCLPHVAAQLFLDFRCVRGFEVDPNDPV